MGFLNDLTKTLFRAGKDALTDELRQETRQQVHDAVKGTKEGISNIGKAAKESITKKTSDSQKQAEPQAQQTQVEPPLSQVEVQPQQTQTEPQSQTSNTAPDASTISSQTMQSNPSPASVPKATSAPSSTTTTDIVQLLNKLNLTSEQQTELKKDLEFLNSKEQQEQAADLSRQLGPEFEEKLRAAGLDPNKLSDFLKSGQEAAEELKKQ